MTEREPPWTSVESWVDKQIRDAQACGEFDNLPGAGKPLPGAGDPEDENWWLRSFLRREKVGDAVLPPALRLHKDIEELPGRVASMRSEAEVRAAVDDLNERVRESWRGESLGIRPVGLVDPAAVVEQWRTHRLAATPDGTATTPPDPTRPAAT